MTCMFPNSYISFLQLSLDVCFRGFLVLMLLTVTTLRLIQIRVTKIDDSWNRICHTIRIALQCTMQERSTTWQVVHCKWDSNALGYELILMHIVIILKHSIIELHVWNKWFTVEWDCLDSILMNVFTKTPTIMAFFSCPIIWTLLLPFTWPSLSVPSVLYIVVAFTYLDIRLFLSKAARMFISLFQAGIFVCASAHSGELSCWEIQMSLSVFRFPAPYLFPMRKPWIKDLCPIGPEPSARFFILVVFPLKPKEGNHFYWMKY